MLALFCIRAKSVIFIFGEKQIFYFALFKSVKRMILDFQLSFFESEA